MNKKLYKMMNWPEIEGIIYSDEKNPGKILGPHTVGGQTLVQVFLPYAKKVTILSKASEEEVPMELADEEGYFAALLNGKNRTDYTLKVQYKDAKTGKNETQVMNDPYSFPVKADERMIKAFHAGNCINIQEYLGAHSAVIAGVSGLIFRVWAPEAARVSVIGQFNQFDGRIHQMNYDEATQIYSLFIPNLKPGVSYCYEIRKQGGAIVRKADPYSKAYMQWEDGTASVYEAKSSYKWQDDNWKRQKEDYRRKDLPMNICEWNLSQMLDKEENFGKRIEELIRDIKMLGYTHVQISDALFGNPEKKSVHETKGFFAVSEIFGNSDGLRMVVDLLHINGIGVILDYSAAAFCSDSRLMAEYDGSCLYEHLDPRKGFHNAYQVKLFNYTRPEVKSLLYSSLIYLAKEFHADGIRFCDTSFMMYIDYGKTEGEWVPNIYGGNDDLEAIDFIQSAVALLNKECEDVITFTDEASGWENLTKKQDDNGFGFDYKWDYSYVNDLLKYLAVDPIERSRIHHDLTISFLYIYKERFVHALAEDYLFHSDCGLACLNQEDALQRCATAKLLLAYNMVVPGKKLNTYSIIEKNNFNYMKAVNRMYLEYPALYELDESDDGFEWINLISANECVLIFLRKNAKQTLLVAVNFANCKWPSHKVGVPFDGKYKEIFNTDAEEFDGTGYINNRILRAKEDECDTRDYSIRINMAPLSLCVFEYIPYSPEELKKIQEKNEEKKRKAEEQKRQRKLLQEEKNKIRASLKEELARKIAQAEAEIASGSEFVQKDQKTKTKKVTKKK